MESLAHRSADQPFAQVIAEIGTNHNQDISLARDLMAGAASAGCDYVKFQIYEPDEIVSERLRTSDYSWVERYGDISLRDAFGRYLKTPKEWIPELSGYAEELQIRWGATIHGYNGLQWALSAKPAFIKIASMDHTNTPFLADLVNTVDVPIVVSTGMASLDGIDAAYAAVSSHKPGVILLHCNAVYPPKADNLNLSNIGFLQDRYGCGVGFSDHSLGADAAISARGAGAVLFEKHITTDQTLNGPDHSFAIELEDLGDYVRSVKETTADPSPPSRNFLLPAQEELENRPVFLKSVIARHDLKAGTLLSPADVYFARPGTGIPPTCAGSLYGRALTRPVPAEMPIMWRDFQSS